jgi:hypothetical protein
MLPLNINPALVVKVGVEPTILSALVSKTSLYTSSSTRPRPPKGLIKLHATNIDHIEGEEVGSTFTADPASTTPVRAGSFYNLIMRW